MSRRVGIVVNPIAGRRKNDEKIFAIDQFMSVSDLSYDLWYTTPDSGASRVIETQLDSSYTDLMIVGGDGTINQAVNAMMRKGLNPELTIIPIGSGNDFVKNFNIGGNLRDQLTNLLSGQSIPVDLGKCNDQYFVNGIGLGFDGQIAEAMLHNKSIFSGHMAYYYHVLRILATFKEREIDFEVDGEHFKRKALLLTIANGTTFGGGFRLTPEARTNDGVLNICLIEEISPLRRFLNVNKLEKGVHNRLAEVSFLKGRAVKVKANNMVAHIDGEYLGHPPFDIELQPNHLRLRVKQSNR